MLKCKDWPAAESFRSRCRRHHQDLLERLPVSHYTCPEASYESEGGVAPQLPSPGSEQQLRLRLWAAAAMQVQGDANGGEGATARAGSSRGGSGGPLTPMHGASRPAGAKAAGKGGNEPSPEQLLPPAPLNLATALPPHESRTDLGPKCYLAYGREVESEAGGDGDSVTKLHEDMSDGEHMWGVRGWVAGLGVGVRGCRLHSP